MERLYLRLHKVILDFIIPQHLEQDMASLG